MTRSGRLQGVRLSCPAGMPRPPCSRLCLYDLDPLIRPLELSPAEQSDLVAFLHSLTSPNVASLVERAQAAEINNPGEAR